MKIREVTTEDQQKVKRFVLSVLVDEFGFPRKPEWDYDLEDPIKYYQEQGGNFYILENNKKLIGTIAIKNKGNKIAELKRMYVDKKFRGKGLGRKLFDKAIKFSVQNKFEKVILDTWNKFDTAKKIYKKNGFKVIGREGEQIFMEKGL